MDKTTVDFALGSTVRFIKNELGGVDANYYEDLEGRRFILLVRDRTSTRQSSLSVDKRTLVRFSSLGELAAFLAEIARRLIRHFTEGVIQDAMSRPIRDYGDDVSMPFASSSAVMMPYDDYRRGRQTSLPAPQATHEPPRQPTGRRITIIKQDK